MWVQDYQLQLVPQMLRDLAARPAHRLLPPHPLPAGRALLPAAVAPPDPRGAARRRPHRLPAAAVRPPTSYASCASRVGHKTHRDLIYLPDGRHREGRRRSRSRSTRPGSRSWPARRRSEERAAEIREALGNPRRIFLGVDRLDYTKGIYSRLRAFGELVRDGHLDVEDAVFVQVATPVARARRAVPHPARRHRPARRADQRRPRPDRPPGHLTTSTPPTPARRWPRSTGPPTSWSSRRSATG